MTEMMKAYNERKARKARSAEKNRRYLERTMGYSLKGPTSYLGPVNRKSTKRSTCVMSGGTFGVPAATERRI